MPGSGEAAVLALNNLAGCAGSVGRGYAWNLIEAYPGRDLRLQRTAKIGPRRPGLKIVATIFVHGAQPYVANESYCQGTAMQMVRRITAAALGAANIVAAIFLAAIIGVATMVTASIGAKAAYSIEHVGWGNEDFRGDRIYARDLASGRRLVLSRHWGRRCNRRGALNYGLGGGCWYPTNEAYSTWRKKPQGGLSLNGQRRWYEPLLFSGARRHAHAVRRLRRAALKPHAFARKQPRSQSRA
jgi:hypothetical protein